MGIIGSQPMRRYLGIKRLPTHIGMAARTAVVAGTATAVSGRVARRQANKYADQDAQYVQQQTAAATQEIASSAVELARTADELEALVGSFRLS